MSEKSMATNLVANRGNRCTATILGWLEDNLYEQHQIPKGVQRQIRQIVLDNVNGYKDLVIDIMKSETAVLNDIYVENLIGIREELERINGD